MASPTVDTSLAGSDVSCSTRISLLPPELLISIFVICANTEALVPLTLGRVSRGWRDIVNGTPQIWQLISMDTERPLHVSHTQAELWMARSCPLPFDVTVNLESVNLLLPLLSPMLPHIRRWRRFTLTGKRIDSLDMKSVISSENSLDCLRVGVQTVIHDHCDNDPTFLVDESTFAMNVRVDALPQPPVLPSSLRFTSVEIRETYPFDSEIQISQLLTFLTVFPDLQTLGYHQFPRDTEVAENVPMAHLHRLRTLTIHGTCSTRTILSHMDAPSLEHLNLEHLNVDFGLIPSAYEEGDSDDEANDFSQSPWSDQAIGMGLRSLINRCSPPLVMLNMDYSDMRTKDFRWCFDRLTTLQEFRIVASDLSDNVMQFFAPYRVEADGSNEARLQVRLPRLQKLELRNCHQVSGDAVVAALRSRVMAVDGAVVEAAQLVDVAVIGCDNVHHSHGQTLSQFLGWRLRLE